MKNYFFIITLFLLLGMPLLVQKQVCSARLELDCLWSDSVDVPLVFYPEEMSPFLRATIDDFARVLSELSGQNVYAKKSPLILKRGFYFGETFADDFLSTFSFMGDDHLISDKVYASLRKAGVCWFNESDLGESIPFVESMLKDDFFSDAVCPYERSLAFFASEDRTKHSGFISASLSGVSHEFSKRNSLYRSVIHGHNLRNIFTVDVFAEHPEWFPRYGKDRYGPPNSFQPNFSSIQAAEYTARVLEVKSKLNTKKNVFSVCINDNSNFGHQLNESPYFDEKSYFRGYPDLAPYVFNWTNHVARSFSEFSPDRYISQYAYALCEKAPDFPIEANVIPILTADRSQWYDPVFKQEDIDNIRAWMELGSDIVGTYDYLYGKPFFIPRIFDASLYESIQTFHALKMDSYYAEIYPHPAYDSFKQWMLVEVLKDSSLEYTELRNSFFSRYYGESEEPMRAFFDECERIWMAQDGEARWIKYYADVNQAFLFTDSEIRGLRDRLNEALDLAYLNHKNTRFSAETESYLKRVLATSEFFYFTQLMYEYVQVMQEIAALDASIDMNDETEALIRKFYEMRKSIEDSQKSLIARKYTSEIGFSICEKFGIYTGELTSLARQYFSVELGVNTWRKRPNYTLVEDVCMDVLTTWNDDDPIAVSEFVDSIMSCDRDMRNLSILKSDFRKMGGNLLKNPSFEEGLKDWRSTHRNGDGLSFYCSDKWSSSGQKSIQIKNAMRATLVQYVELEAGKKYMLEAKVYGKISPEGRTALRIKLLDEHKKVTSTVPQARLAAGKTKAWKRLVILTETTEATKWAKVQLLTEYHSRGDVTYFDEISLREVD